MACDVEGENGHFIAAIRLAKTSNISKLPNQEYRPALVLKQIEGKTRKGLDKRYLHIIFIS